MPTIMAMDRMEAWDRLHEALATLPGWQASRPQRDPLSGTWVAVAFDASVRGRGRPRPSLEAGGATEAEAVARLAELVVTHKRGVRGGA